MLSTLIELDFVVAMILAFDVQPLQNICETFVVSYENALRSLTFACTISKFDLATTLSEMFSLRESMNA
jgi:hypothetical protein